MTFFIAEEMVIPVTGTTLSVEGSLDVAGFTGARPDVRPGDQEIRAVIDVATTASAADVERLRAAVEARCPVSDDIARATPVEITMRPAGRRRSPRRRSWSCTSKATSGLASLAVCAIGAARGPERPAV